MYRSSSVQRRSLAELTGGFNETERNFFPEAGKMLSRNFRDFTGAALALSRISLMPDLREVLNVPSEEVAEPQKLSDLFDILWGLSVTHRF